MNSYESLSINLLFTMAIIAIALSYVVIEVSNAAAEGRESIEDQLNSFCNDRGMEFVRTTENRLSLFGPTIKTYCFNIETGDSIEIKYDIEKGKYANTGFRAWVIN